MNREDALFCSRLIADPAKSYNFLAPKKKAPTLTAQHNIFFRPSGGPKAVVGPAHVISRQDL